MRLGTLPQLTRPLRQTDCGSSRICNCHCIRSSIHCWPIQHTSFPDQRPLPCFLGNEVGNKVFRQSSVCSLSFPAHYVRAGKERKNNETADSFGPFATNWERKCGKRGNEHSESVIGATKQCDFSVAGGRFFVTVDDPVLHCDL